MRIRGHWALVPLKAQGAAKSRLAGVLTPAQRAALQRAMLADLLQGLSHSRLLDGVAIYAPEAVAIAPDFGHPVIQLGQASHARDLNAAVADGAARLAGLGARSVAVLPGDLPLLEAADVDDILALVASRRCRVVVPDRWGTGTNGLVFPAEARPRFSYGPGSFARHAHGGGEDGFAEPALALGLPSFSCDIDTPEDIAAFLREQHGPRGLRTRSIVERFERTPELAAAEETSPCPSR